eukprot:Cvel_27544.t1-p1 / transcript=Cvel_27544.t1 / gene=Cvel_27544 / organism=Chromera_velia_CCMP2878 / gene_product=hypothetical protein / transcript_product=hypothetical protein / location=Cvel_scaffold3457:379-4604(-) / protein_length=251 / sequence_SO=supercontig / SO=protein_coding / is_pseudo=false
MSSRPLLLPTELSEALVDQLEMVGKPFLEEGSACTCRSCGTSCPPAYLHLQIEAYLHPSDHHNPGRAAREHMKLRGRFVCFGCRLAVQDLSVSVVSIHQAGVAFASKEEQLFDLPISNDALNADNCRQAVSQAVGLSGRVVSSGIEGSRRADRKCRTGSTEIRRMVWLGRRGAEGGAIGGRERRGRRKREGDGDGEREGRGDPGRSAGGQSDDSFGGADQGPGLTCSVLGSVQASIRIRPQHASSHVCGKR